MTPDEQLLALADRLEKLPHAPDGVVLYGDDPEDIIYSGERNDIVSALRATATAPAGAAIPDSSDMDARFAWLEAKAIDMGYVLTPEPQHPDSPHFAPTAVVAPDGVQKEGSTHKDPSSGTERSESETALRREVSEAWQTLESFGFPPEACGWPFQSIEGELPNAIKCAMECIIRQRDVAETHARDSSE